MFWNKKKQQKNDYKNIIGLTNSRELNFTNSGNFMLPVSRAILCFLLTVASICGYVSCFKIEFNLYFVMGFLLIFSFAIAYVRSFGHKFIKNLFYILLFFVFFYSIIHFYRYVNSGYHAIVNITYAALERYLGIPALIHYEETIENSYATVSVFLLFLGVFELLLYHMWISEGIRIYSIFALCFIPYAIPLFLRYKPDNLYIIMLLASSISVIFLYCSRHVHKIERLRSNFLSDKIEKLRSNFGDTGFTTYRKINLWSSDTPGFSYTVNGLTYFMTIVISTVLSLFIFLIVSVSVPYPAFQRNERNSSLKESVTDEVEYFVTFGLNGFFNRYRATGGLSEGRLGGIYSVRPDYSNDLLVTYVPYSYSPLYLRGFVGVGYTDRQWLNADTLYGEKIISPDIHKVLTYDTGLVNEKSLLSTKIPEPLRMKITNLDANVNYGYTPYYSDLEGYDFYNPDILSQFRTGTTNTYDFYPYSPVSKSSFYLEFDDKNLIYYLQVPENTRNEIYKFLYDEELFLDYIAPAGSYSKISGTELQKVLLALSNEFSDRFTYSLNPGITPKNKDFVGHFLNKNKKGFCSHFATSAALILRTLGIPARYVEGYVITYDNSVEFSIEEDLDISDFIDPQSSLDDASVITAHVNDSKAHAWVEYYDPNFGWRVFEATTASIEPDSGSTDFWSNIFRLIGSENDTESDDINIGNNTLLSANVLSDILCNFVIAVLFIVILIFVLYCSYKFAKQYRSYHRNRNSINVRNYYKIICRTICRKYPEFDYLISTSKQLEFISTHYRLSKKINQVSLDKLAVLLEQAQFSKKQLTDIECKFSMEILKLIRRNITFRF